MSVSHHFLNLIEALQECNSTPLPMVSTLFALPTSPLLCHSEAGEKGPVEKLVSVCWKTGSLGGRTSETLFYKTLRRRGEIGTSFVIILECLKLTSPLTFVVISS